MVAEQTVPPAGTRRARRQPALQPVVVPVTERALNRLPWPMQHRVTIAGVPVLVRASSESLWEAVLEHVPLGRPFPAERTPKIVYSVTPIGAPHLLEPVNQHVVYRWATRIARDKDTDVVLKALLSDLTAVVAQYAPRWTFVHAGAVSWKGRGIILPGPPGAGKSTLVTALLRLGARYHSDEVAMIDSAGRLHPFHKPLWLHREVPGAKEMVTVGALGARPDHRARPVAIVAFPERKQGAALQVTPVTRSVAALGIFANGFSARSHPVRSLNHATRAVEGAFCFHLQYGEADAVAEHLIGVLESNPNGAAYANVDGV